MTLPPGLYSGTSSLALVARASAFGLGLVYGNMKLKVLKPPLIIKPLFFLYNKMPKAGGDVSPVSLISSFMIHPLA
ncbi:putative protein [Arabidopsis thaliana]|uniref:Uncharacterized protein F8M21_210 n=1 Tax=Arabidopsis thaliana TaxID=3702 RepID=Q9LXF0_ARATH|nr:putative protein [Arabidopsis thaliana]